MASLVVRVIDDIVDAVAEARNIHEGRVMEYEQAMYKYRSLPLLKRLFTSPPSIPWTFAEECAYDRVKTLHSAIEYLPPSMEILVDTEDIAAVRLLRGVK